MNEEVIRMNQRAKGTPENLLCPLRRQLESGKLLFVRQAMQIKVEEAELKNPKGDYKEAWQKVGLLVEIEEYLRQVYELAYQLNTAAFRAEQRITILQIKYDELLKQNEILKNNVTL
jgi:hypothetical protein